MQFIFSLQITNLACLVGVKPGCTFCFIVHVGNVDASQSSSQGSLPNPALATDEDLVVNCVHS